MAKRLKMTKSVLGNDRDRVGPVEAWVDKEGDLVLNAPAGDGPVYVSPEQWQALVAAVKVVDAPEPWERLRDALRVAALEKTPDDQHPAHRVPSDVLRRAAELLGITEGE